LKKKTKALKYGLAATLVGQAVIPTVVLAEDIKHSSTDEKEQEINIQIAQQKDIDIVLTVGNSNVDPKTFEADLLKELKERNIDNSRVNIQAIETTSISTNDANAEKIFNEWTMFPYNYNGSDTLWRYDSTNKWLISDVNPPFETGFIDEKQGMVSDFTLESDIYISQPIQPVGFVFGIHPNEEDPNRYNLYYLWVSTDSEANQTVVALFKVEGQNFDYPNRKTHAGTYSATPLRPYNGAYFGWPDHQPFSYGGFPHGTPQQRGLTVTNVADSKLKTTILDFAKVQGTSGWSHLKLDVNKNKFVVYFNGQKLISFTDENDPYEKGYYGIFQYSHVKPIFKNVQISTETTKTFNEVLQQPEWRENTERFIINMEDNLTPDFDSASALGEIFTRLMNEDINYIGLGTEANKEQSLDFIERNDGNGLFVDNTDYKAAIENIADYIVRKLTDNQKVVTEEEPYVTAGTPIKFNVKPAELQTNTANEEYPNGRWKLIHNEDYYDNGNGSYQLDGKYQNSLPTVLDKVGQYEILFEESHTNIPYLYVHRKPIADFSMNIEKTADGVTVTTVDNSYDPDHQSEENKGIVERKWRWKETTATTWNDGQLPSNLPEGKHYLLQLQVKDQQGAWSVPVTAYVTTDTSVKTTPIANYTLLNDTVVIENELEISDSSYDPAGKPLTTKEWKVYKGKELVYTGATPIKDFSSYGLGEYTIQLTVTNSEGIKSEPFSRTIKVVEQEYIEALDNIDEINHNLKTVSTKEGLENLKRLAEETEELIDGLQEGEYKEHAREEFEKVNQHIESVSEVQEVKEVTEHLYTQSEIEHAKNLHNEALELVNKLPEGDIKTHLIEKLNEYLSIITEAEENLISAKIINEKDVELNWEPYEGANSYRVYVHRLNPETGEYEEYSFPRAANAENVVITGLEAGCTYLFKVYPRKNGVIISDEPIGVVATEIPVPEPEPIPTVQNVSVTVNGTEATVTWDKLEEALRYRVQAYVKDPTTGEFVKEGFGRTTVSNSIVMKNLGEGKTYKFEIIPNIEYTYIEEAAGVSSEVTIGSVVEEEPVVESSLTVTIDGTTAHLSWEPIEDATRYRVQRYIKDEDTGLFVKDGYAKAITDTEITFDDLKPGTEYKFEVTPRIGWIYDSDYAISATAKTEAEEEEEKPTTEVNLTVTLDGTTAYLTWDTIEDATRYRVQKYIKNEETGEFVQDNYAKTVNGTELSFTDLVEGAEYKFEVVPLIGYMYDYDYAIYKTVSVDKAEVEE
jgi:Fibronectin type III domain